MSGERFKMISSKLMADTGVRGLLYAVSAISSLRIIIYPCLAEGGR